MKVKITMSIEVETNDSPEEIKKNWVENGKIILDHMLLETDQIDDSFYVFDFIDAE